ncbi:MAG: isopropylmalate isomerase, partial [Anaerolineaceae bacterium 4572_5.2]
MNPKTLFQKIWESHLVAESDDAPSIIYIDLHLIHEVTSPQAFSGLREKGLKVRRPERTIGTMDHSTPTISLDLESADAMAVQQLHQFEKNCKDFGIEFYGLDSPNRG